MASRTRLGQEGSGAARGGLLHQAGQRGASGSVGVRRAWARRGEHTGTRESHALPCPRAQARLRWVCHPRLEEGRGDDARDVAGAAVLISPALPRVLPRGSSRGGSGLTRGKRRQLLAGETAPRTGLAQGSPAHRWVLFFPAVQEEVHRSHEPRSRCELPHSPWPASGRRGRQRTPG